MTWDLDQQSGSQRSWFRDWFSWPRILCSPSNELANAEALKCADVDRNSLNAVHLACIAVAPDAVHTDRQHREVLVQDVARRGCRVVVLGEVGTVRRQHEVVDQAAAHLECAVVEQVTVDIVDTDHRQHEVVDQAVAHLECAVVEQVTVDVVDTDHRQHAVVDQVVARRTCTVEGQVTVDKVDTDHRQREAVDQDAARLEFGAIDWDTVGVSQWIRDVGDQDMDVRRVPRVNR